MCMCYNCPCPHDTKASSAQLEGYIELCLIVSRNDHYSSPINALVVLGSAIELFIERGETRANFSRRPTARQAISPLEMSM
jgi:hypothetical protein